jgi:hypothetical protein
MYRLKGATIGQRIELLPRVVIEGDIAAVFTISEPEEARRTESIRQIMIW